MTQKNAYRIHLIYRCILAGLVVALAIMLIFSCLDIYKSSPRSFTPQAIALKFQVIKILVYITVFFIIGGILLDILLPVKARKESKSKQALVKDTASNAHTTTSPVRSLSWRIWGIRCGIVLLACILIVVGIWNGGAADVLKKAVAICTECIGLG